jgi:gamma-glutamyltranspeptidase / glutathione hydrolase
VGCIDIFPLSSSLTKNNKQEVSSIKKSKSSKVNQPYGVSASQSIAIDVGMKVMKNGGNAIDAAIAISYVLGVVEPFGSGLGGGGGMLIVPNSEEANFIDYREISPKIDSTSSGVPGLVAGMQYVHEKYGSLPMKDLLQPAIYYAENGFKVDQALSNRLMNAKPRVYSNNTLLYYPNHNAIKPGKALIQKDLAKTLKLIQEKGMSGFYEGEVAKGINKVTKIPLEDLKQYSVKEQLPVKGEYAGYEVYTAPPPFSGVTLLQMLKLAEQVNLIQSPNEAAYITGISDITKVAYQDRLKHIGDNVDTKKAEQWVDNSYISKLKNEMQDGNFRNLTFDDTEEHVSTTHFVVIDKDGTIVSATNTLSNFFGSGKYTHGFFLNDSMKNFGKGLNIKEHNKRPRTFTAPTVLQKKGKEIIGIGSPGGNRIPQILMQIIYSYSEEISPFQMIVNRSRFVFDNNIIYTESPFSEETTNALIKQRFKVIHKVSPMYYGGVQVLLKDEVTSKISGAGDPRRNGNWKVQK